MKIEIVLAALITILLIVMVSGCTENTGNNSNLKKYNGTACSFSYPSAWSISSDQGDMIKLKTGNGETRIWVYNSNSPVEIENFPETKTVGNVTYKKMPPGSGDNLVSYVIRKDGRDFFMIGVPSDQDGHETILKTVNF